MLKKRLRDTQQPLSDRVTVRRLLHGLGSSESEDETNDNIIQDMDNNSNSHSNTSSEIEINQKHSRSPPQEDFSAAFDSLPIISDTEIAIRKLLSEFPRTVVIKKRSRKADITPTDTIQNTAPMDVVLVSQLCEILKNRTRLEYEMDTLCKRGLIRKVQLAIGAPNEAIVLTEQYQDYLKRQGEQVQIVSKHEANVLRVFSTWLQSINAASGIITIEALKTMVDDYFDIQSQTFGKNNTLKCTPEEISRILLHEGLATRRIATQIEDLSELWLTIPQSRLLHKCIDAGRKEVIRRVGNTRYRELPRAKLEEKFKHKFGTSVLGARFHIRDAVGAGLVHLQQTASGTFLRRTEGLMNMQR